MFMEYLSAGRNKKFLWDGVDTIGNWNRKQSEDYSWTARGWFGVDQNQKLEKDFMFGMTILLKQ